MRNIASSFREMHQRGNPFILANAWDRGSAKMLVGLGARAIATSSAAHAFTLGKPDLGNVSRDEALAHAQDILSAVTVPVSGDFENGFGAAPEICAETVRLAAEIGLAGISIEDIALPNTTPYDFDLAVERIQAAASAARALPNDFVLVARADGVMHGAYDLDEALRRVRAFDATGADCLYVPCPGTLQDLSAICNATQKPVNALIVGPFATLSHQQIAQLGVARISLGAAIARVTHQAILDVGQAMFEQGDFSHLTRAAAGSRVDALL